MSWFARSIDGLVAAVSPEAGNRRSAARLRADYGRKMAERYRQGLSGGGFKSAGKGRDSHDWMTSRLSAQSALESDRETILERSDSAYKNYELGANFVEGRVTRVVGTGFSLDPDIDDSSGVSREQAERWNDALGDAWALQSQRLGKRGKPLRKIQQLCQRHYDRHGEFFVLIGDQHDPFTPTTLRVEVIHPRRVETPPGKSGDPLCRMGVQLSESNEVLGYHVRDGHPGDDKDPKESFTYIPATFANGLPRVVHVYEETESGVERGLPRMQVGQNRLKNSSEYDAAESERNYVAACHAVFVQTDLSAAEALPGEVLDADNRRVREYAPGTVNYFGLSDNISLSNPQGAPSSYEAFMRQQDMKFAAGCGSSYEILANDFRGLSYSTARVLWNVEEASCEVAQENHADLLRAVWCNFVYRMATTPDSGFDVDQTAFRSQPWHFCAVRIIRPKKAAVDPQREHRDELTMVEAAVKPGSDFVERMNGIPARKVYRRVARDRAARRAEGIEEHMPNMGRDPQEESDRAPTQAGDGNPAAVEPNEDRAGVVA